MLIPIVELPLAAMTDLEQSKGPYSRLRAAKKMRKGTHSCVECRRRKIRCVMPLESQVCASCHRRGSQCIDQSGEPYPRAGFIRNNNTTNQFSPGSVRRVVSTSAEQSPDIDASPGSCVQHPPLVSVLESLSAPRTIPVSRTSASRPSASLPHAKAKAICESLRSSLPSFDRISDVLSKNGTWWDSFRDKTRVISQAHFERLDTFAAKAYTSMKPAELGILAIAYARSLSQGFHQLMETAENLILSDMSYAATIDGMMCLILLGKTYTDIGHPRRAWLVWRRGIAVAQFMGYHREDCVGLGKRGLWWAVYHGDRFTSMLLGLPHGCSDSILEPQFRNVANNIPLEHHFAHRCAVVAGRVIERNVALAKMPYSELMAIDEEMDAISDSMPLSWWDIPNELSHSGVLNLHELRERLLLHFYFFHVRLHLHLPSMTRSETVHATAHVSRLACIAAARQLIKRFNLLNMTAATGQRLFECKTSIFVAFTGAVVLALGVYHLSDHPCSILASQEDERLLLAFYAALKDEERRNGCNISLQCQTALGALLKAPKHGHCGDGDGDIPAAELPAEIRIPYFGKISRLNTGDGGSGHVGPRSLEIGFPPTTDETFSSVPVSPPSAIPKSPGDFWTYQYPETWMPGPLMTGSDVDNGYDELPSQLDMLDVDLDWDWASFSTN